MKLFQDLFHFSSSYSMTNSNFPILRHFPLLLHHHFLLIHHHQQQSKKSIKYFFLFQLRDLIKSEQLEEKKIIKIWYFFTACVSAPSTIVYLKASAVEIFANSRRKVFNRWKSWQRARERKNKKRRKVTKSGEIKKLRSVVPAEKEMNIFRALILSFVICGVLGGRLKASSKIFLDECFTSLTSTQICRDGYSPVNSTTE